MHARYACCHRVSIAALFPHSLHSFLSHSFFFPFAGPSRPSARPGTRLLPDQEAIDRARARDGYLRRADQTDRTDVIEPRYFIARAFELRVLAPFTRTNLLRASSWSCARRLENYMPRDVWILRSVRSFSHWLSVGTETKRVLCFNLSLWIVFKRTRDIHRLEVIK